MGYIGTFSRNTTAVLGVPIGKINDLNAKVNYLLSIAGASFIGTQEKTLTSPNGSTTTFSFTHAPKVIVYNGAVQIYTGNSGYDDITVSGDSVTFLNGIVPISSDRITNIYQ